MPSLSSRLRIPSPVAACLISCGLSFTLTLSAPTTAVAESGSLLLYGGTIHTFEGDEPRSVEALVAVDGEVVFVGSLTEARRRMPEFVGGTTRGRGVRGMEEIDLRGAVAVPGLVDAHVHLFNLGKLATRVTFFGSRSAQECVALAKEHERTLAVGDWLLGRGWDQNDWEDKRFPTRELLDEVFGDRPVLLERVDGHATWANTAALRAAGIEADTPDPEGGEILRDSTTGEPTGLLVDTAEDLVWNVVPAADAAKLDRRLRAASEQALRVGLTGIHEMGSNPQQIAALRRADARGELDLRCVVYLGGDEVLRGWKEDPLRPGPEEMLRIEGVKLYMDGALGSRGAALLEDYSDRPGHRGLRATSDEEMARRVSRAFDRGFSVAIHAIGDAGNRAALDAIAKGYQSSSQRNPGLGPLASLRPRIEHCQILDPGDIPRFAGLGIIPSMQPTHCTSDMPWAPRRLGDARLEGAYAWRSLRDTGCEIPLGSDAPVESISPLTGLYAARTRQDAEGFPPEGWSSEQCLDATEALLGYTAWTGRAVGVPQWGTLRPGSRADITVLSVDPLGEPASALLDAEVLRTVVEGRTVFITQ